MTDFGAPENRRGNEARWSADHGIKPLTDEIERLRQSLDELDGRVVKLTDADTRNAHTIERRGAERDEWRALTDDAADLLTRRDSHGWAIERDAWIARYWEARQQ